jgi:hypothetical protein
LTREELIALAIKYGPEPDVTDPVEYISEPKNTLVLVNDQFYHWDDVTKDFMEV